MFACGTGGATNRARFRHPASPNDAASPPIGFASTDYRAPFIAGDGWGTFAQRIDADGATARLEMRWGHLDLAPTVAAEWRSTSPGRLTVDFANPVTVRPGEALTIEVS